jgi:hypothetical protein
VRRSYNLGIPHYEEHLRSIIPFGRRSLSFACGNRKDQMTREELEACLKNPRSHKWGLIYSCKADPRAIVPRRLKWMGWTVNFARPSAIPLLGLLLAVLAVPVWIVTAEGAGTGIVFVTGGAAIAVVCVLCAYLSSRTT